MSNLEGFPSYSLNGQITCSNMFSQSLSEPFIKRELVRWVRAQRANASSHYQYNVYLKEQTDGFTVECTVQIKSGIGQWASKTLGPGAHAAVRRAIEPLKLT